MKKMVPNAFNPRPEKAPRRAKSSNVKPSRKYDRFGETIRYLTYQELQQFFDSIDNYRHKLMMQMIYELGCRVGEFVRIKLKHLNFSRSTVLFPEANTKTKRRRYSFLPPGLMNEIQSMLKADGRMTRRDGRIRNPDTPLFHPASRRNSHFSENRLRQIFLCYAKKTGLDREYGCDSRGRKLHQLTIHSLRHSHLMHYIHLYKLPLPVVQKQVGHRSLKATSAYLNPSDELVAQAYSEARQDPGPKISHAERFISSGVVIPE